MAWKQASSTDVRGRSTTASPRRAIISPSLGWWRARRWWSRQSRCTAWPMAVSRRVDRDGPAAGQSDAGLVAAPRRPLPIAPGSGSTSPETITTCGSAGRVMPKLTAAALPVRLGLDVEADPAVARAARSRATGTVSSVQPLATTIDLADARLVQQAVEQAADVGPVVVGRDDDAGGPYFVGRCGRRCDPIVHREGPRRSAGRSPSAGPPRDSARAAASRFDPVGRASAIARPCTAPDPHGPPLEFERRGQFTRMPGKSRESGWRHSAPRAVTPPASDRRTSARSHEVTVEVR